MAQKKIKSVAYKKGSKEKLLEEAMPAYSTAQKTLGMIGGRASTIAGTVVKEESDFIELIKKGIPRKSLDLLIAITGITANEMAALMHTSDRTLRRYKPSTLLNTEQSERVIEIARLYSRGEEVFGNMDLFKEWMNATQMVLGNQKPKDFLDTSMGIELLMKELGRAEQGVYS